MKKLILTALVAVSALTANAQAWMGGSLGLNIRDYENPLESQTDIKIAPEIGYSLNDNWDIAVALSYANTKNLNGLKDANLTTYAIEPYARYTFAKTGITSFFVDGGVGIGASKPKGGDSVSTFYVGVQPGVKVALSDKVCLVTKLGKLGYTSVEDTYSEFGFGVDNSAINFGLYFAL